MFKDSRLCPSISIETIDSITFARVHRIGKKRTYANVVQSTNVIPTDSLPDEMQPRPSHTVSKPSGPRPIVASFEHHKQHELVRSLGRRLKGKPFGINEQFPAAVLERCRALLPIYRTNRQRGRRVSLVSDKLYIDNKLFKDPNITTWLE